MISNPLMQITVHPTMLMDSSTRSKRFECIIAEVSITPNYSINEVFNVTAVKTLLYDCQDLLGLNNINSHILNSPSPKIYFDYTIDEQDISLKKLRVLLVSLSDWLEIIKYGLTFWITRKPTDPNNPDNAVDINNNSYPYMREKDFGSSTDYSLDSDSKSNRVRQKNESKVFLK